MARGDFKRCPRCERKMLISQDKCEGCGLIFARLAKATNRAAKQALKRKEKNKVICDSVLPKDLRKWRIFWRSFPLGFTGWYMFYVGRYKMGWFYLIATVMIVTAACLPLEWLGTFWGAMLIGFLYTPMGLVAVFWITDIVRILFNKFKVPISIEEDLIPSTDEFDKVLAVVDDINKKNSNKNKDKEIQKTLKDIDKQLKEKKDKENGNE